MEPHYFGSSDKQLFGVYHPPTGKARAHGVVLCPPAPQEYMRTHMAMRRLASLLAREGFHALRFDYYGTGDSAGDDRAGGLTEWSGNVAAAVDDLKDCSGVSRVSLLGLRLGATLAAMTPVKASNLILWEPVVDGNAYCDELRVIHTRKFSNLLFPPPLPDQASGGELLGLPWPAAMEREMRSINLLGPFACRAEHVMLVVSEERPEYVALRTQLMTRTPPTFDYHFVPDEPQAGQDEAMLLSGQVLRLVPTALARRAS